MRCLHPVIATYVDIMGIEHSYERPCGHCIACLHNQQDSWCIRLTESCNHFKDFVYDTLTISNANMSYRNITDHVLEYGYENLDSSIIRLLDRYSVFDDLTGESMLLAPCLDKSLIQNWLKRGRENFYLAHGFRLKLKYFIVEEYGPKTSRPHFHLLMFGVSHGDYIKYFAKPWRRDCGFTRTKYVKGGTDKDRNCICRYISKYVSKGVFESPLVQYGFIPKPFRLISKGIGEEYLNNEYFNYFRDNWKCQFLRDITVDKSYLSGDLERTRYIRYFNSINDLSVDSSKIFDDWHLTTYYDSNGFAHSLPRYYKHKLLNASTPNLLYYQVQTHLLEAARLHFNKTIQRFAASLGFQCNWDEASPSAGFDEELFDFLCREFAITQKLQSRFNAKRCYTKLKNHYGRSMNLSAPFAN